MFARVIPPAFVVTAIFALSLGVVSAEKPEAADESPAKIAQQVYDLLLNQYRAGELGNAGQLDLLNSWSERILMAQFSEAALSGDLPHEDVIQKSIRDHRTRMQKLERIVESKYEAQLTPKTELLAARYFRLQGNGIEQIIKTTRQLLQPVEVEGDFDIKMPTVDQARPLAAKPPSIVIGINEEGKLFVEGKELTIEDLNKQVQKVAKDNPKSATVSIRAHPECLYADVVRVLEACGKEGISVSFTTVNDKPEKE